MTEVRRSAGAAGLRQEPCQIGASPACSGVAAGMSKDPLGATRPINARSETVATRASFRGPLAPFAAACWRLSGFYE